MPRIPLPPDLGPGAFSTGEAYRAGLGRGRLRGGDLMHPHHGVHAATSPDDDLLARCRRLLPAMRPEHWFSHATAARIWGIPLMHRYRPDERLHVMSVGASVALRHRGIAGWVTEDTALERRTLAELPVVGPADVWCQLALRDAVVPGRTVGHEWLVAAGDFLVTGPRVGGGGRGAPLCTIEDLRTAVDRRRGTRGVRALERALVDVRGPVDSPRETLLRLGLVAHGLPEPEVQLPVLTRAGIRHADLGYRRARLLLEYQGDEHRLSRKRWLADLTRIQLLQDAGYRVMLVGADDLHPTCAALSARVRRSLSGS